MKVRNIYNNTDAKITDISKRYKIPIPTLQDWKKKVDYSNDWRGLIFDRLSLFSKFENDTLKRLKNLFTQNELKAIWGSLKSTLIDRDLIFNSDYLALGFKDYCLYEEMEARQFTDNLESFSETVSKKLKNLNDFERYVLLEYITNNSNEIFS